MYFKSNKNEELKSMARNEAFSTVTDDSISCTTIESDEIDINCHREPYNFSNEIISTQHQSPFDKFRRRDKGLDLPGPIDSTPIAHISSVALQNTTDVTFGNKTLYNGPVIVNQYGFRGSNETNQITGTKSLV